MMTKEEWEREVEALWTEAAHTFFPMNLIVECIDPELGNLDLGKQADFSVLTVVLWMESGQIRLIHKRQFPLGTPYPNVVAYVARAHQIFNFDSLFIDKGGIGDAIVDELQQIEVRNVRGIFFTDIEKNAQPPETAHGEKTPQNPRRRQTAHSPNQRTTLRILKAQNSPRTNPPKILAPTRPTR
jgi:hypothetical protein